MKQVIMARQTWRTLALLCLISLLLPGCSMKRVDMGVLGKTRQKEKILFTLNGRTFFPVIAYLPNIVQKPVSRSDLDELRAKGFTMVMFSMDYPWIDDHQVELTQLLQDCQEADLPVLLELQEWDFWHSWLRKNPDSNMMLSNGNRVKNYADFLNPRANEEHLRRYREMAEFAKTFRGKPIAALSLGAYDYYHIPDGETHVDFAVPEHSDFPQTWLPYGPHVTSAYVDFLKKKDISPQEIGFERWDDVIPPTNKSSTRVPLHWTTWDWFRKEGYVEPWLSATARIVREASSLPVTVSLDVRPDIWDSWATAGDRWGDYLDFVLVYYYGTYDPDEISARLHLLQQPYLDDGIPLISMMEFSSSLGSFTPADIYINASVPFVSGYMYGFDDTALRHMERLPDFLRLTAELAKSRNWKNGISDSQVAVLLSHDPSSYPSFISAARRLEEKNIPYHAITNIEDADTYRLVFIPLKQPLLFTRKPSFTTIINDLKKGGIVVIEGSIQDMDKALQDLELVRH
jgi:hypothetical protein